MSLRRVAHVRTGAGPGRAVHGSGYLVAPGLVLTAAHVVNGQGDASDGPVTVELAGRSPERLSAEILWIRYDDDVDAALLRLTAAPLPAPSDPAVRWGTLVTELSGREVVALGFPRLQRDDRGRDIEQLSGHIHPGTGARRRRYEIHGVTFPLRTGGAEQVSPWGGMSGAAVFHNDLLIGVVCHDRRPDGGSRLGATRVADLFAEPAFRAALRSATGVDPLLEPAEPARLLAPLVSDRTVLSPSMLLRAEAEVVPFRGRAEEKRQLVAWCEEDPDLVSVRILAGAGGLGKSRLARELVLDMHRRGWVAGLLDRPAAGDATDGLSLLTELRHDLLLVVDYAEGRPQEMREFLWHAHRRALHRPRIRLLLIARAPGAWNKDPMRADADVRAALSYAPVVELRPIAATTIDRRAAHRESARRFGARLDLLRYPFPRHAAGGTARWADLAETLPPPPDIDADRYGTPLDLQMAALTALLDAGTRRAAESRGAPLEQQLLDHEMAYWAWSAPAYRVDLLGEKLERAVAAATLCGAATRTEALDTLSRVPELPAHLLGEIALLLRNLYPPPPGRFWGQLQPDRLAEYLGWRALEGHEGLLPAVLTGATAEQQEQLLVTLVRGALGHLRADRFTAGAELFRRLETTADEIGGLHTEALRGCYAALPDWNLPPVARFGAWAAERLVDAFLSPRSGEDEACRRTREADLAWAWHQRWFYSVTDQAPGGVYEWVRQAVDLRRALAEADRDTYALALASSLHGLAYSQRYRDPEAALATQLEALAIVRTLPAGRKDRDAQVASVLHNLSIAYRDVGRAAEADRALEEAVRLRTALISREPDRYHHAFARSLAVLADAQAKLGRHRLAVAAAEGAVQYYRRFHAVDPTGADEFLAWSLGVLADRLAEVPGGLRTATDRAAEAERIQRRWARRYPEVYRADHAHALERLVRLLLLADDLPRALTASREALAVRVRLVDDSTGHGLADVAGAWSSLAHVYQRLGDRRRALHAVRQATDVVRGLPDAASAGNRNWLAALLGQWAAICLLTAAPGNARHHLEGIPPARESLAILCDLHGGRRNFPDGSPFPAAGTLDQLERRLGRRPAVSNLTVVQWRPEFDLEGRT